ncbi:DUF2058 family protein [Xanthomonadaceae bacterium JHOS43]|nr:DUF2058 family protein [Xanthomonadaceae bacterium JHOS43]
MSDSLKDQLLKLGFKTPPREESRNRNTAPNKPAGRKPQGGKPAAGGRPGKPRTSGEIDLAKAFAIRAQREKEERIEAERQRQEEARLRREAKARLTEFLSRARLNDEAAEIARHFEYGGKIRRIHVTPEQLGALNAGELAVVQLAGRYHLVSAADGSEAERISPGALALLADPNTPSDDDVYADPKYQVPDDLVW